MLKRLSIFVQLGLSVILISTAAITLPLAVGLLRSISDGRIEIAQLFLSGKDKFITYLFKWHPYESFFANFEMPEITAWLLFGYLLFVCIKEAITQIRQFKQKDTYEERSTYGSHGSARWQSEKEMKQNYYRVGEQGFIVGDLKERVFQVEKQYATIPSNGAMNLNMIAFGSPGSEKTTGLILPNIIHIAKDLGYSMIVTDPKAELHKETANWVKQQGYEVQVLDFLYLLRGNRINFLDYIVDDADLLKIADGFVNGVNVARGSKGSADRIWEDGEKSLLAAMIGFVKQAYRDQPEKQTFGTIARLLNTEFRDEENLPQLFKRHGVTGTAEHLFDNFLLTKDKVRDGILSGLVTRLHLFAIPQVQHLTCSNDFDITDLGRRKVALYVMVSDSDRTYSPLVTVFWSIFFNSIYHLRLTAPDAQVPIFCAMDELANIGRISGLQEKLGTMRSRHLYPLMIWQSLPQLKDRYPGHAWADILSMCDTRLLLSANDEDTQTYFSNQLGKTTVEIQGISKQMQREERTYRSQSESASYTGRPLLFPSEIGTLPNDQIIMLQKGKNPAKMRKLQYQYWNTKVCTERPYNSIPLLPPVEQQEGVNPKRPTTIGEKELEIQF